jgi:hypothetical protein
MKEHESGENCILRSCICHIGLELLGRLTTSSQDIMERDHLGELDVDVRILYLIPRCLRGEISDTTGRVGK